MALSKEVIEAEAAEKRARDLKMTALVKHKFKGKLLDKQKAQQEQVVKDAFAHVQEQRELVDGNEKAIYELRADLEKTKVCSRPAKIYTRHNDTKMNWCNVFVPLQAMMDAAVKSKVRLRIQKAQETRKSQKQRLSKAKKDLVLSNEVLDAATAMYEMELRELQRLEASKDETITTAKRADAVGVFSGLVAKKVRPKCPHRLKSILIKPAVCIIRCDRRGPRPRSRTLGGRRSTRRPHWPRGLSRKRPERQLMRTAG